MLLRLDLLESLFPSLGTEAVGELYIFLLLGFFKGVWLIYQYCFVDSRGPSLISW